MRVHPCQEAEFQYPVNYPRFCQCNLCSSPSCPCRRSPSQCCCKCNLPRMISATPIPKERENTINTPTNKCSCNRLWANICIFTVILILIAVFILLCVMLFKWLGSSDIKMLVGYALPENEGKSKSDEYYYEEESTHCACSVTGKN